MTNPDKLADALRGIVELGKRDLTNPKYDAHFDQAREALAAHAASLAAPPAQGQWQPIDTAPKDNKRPLFLAHFNELGQLTEFDWNASWESESESWEIPQIYYYWASENGNVEEPTHWMYQPDWFAAASPQPAQWEWGPVTPDMIRECEAHLPFALTDRRDQWNWKAEYLNRALAAPNAPCACCNVTPAGDIRDDLPAPAPVQPINLDKFLGSPAYPDARTDPFNALRAQPPAPGEVELPPIETLRELATCCRAWEPEVCVMGNVRAGDAASALDAAIAALAQRRVPDAVRNQVSDAALAQAFRESTAHSVGAHDAMVYARARELESDLATIDQQQEARGNGE